MNIKVQVTRFLIQGGWMEIKSSALDTKPNPTSVPNKFPQHTGASCHVRCMVATQGTACTGSVGPWPPVLGG